ncbi:MAG TPA: Ig-like domain-containing protein [Pyrinomonadaceae bacterium]|nr:Ig-like domain-containing protein [Pyrinomonadaceae bacterium]
MKRIPLAALLGVLCFAVLSVFTQHRTAADHLAQQQSNQKTIVNDNGTITVSDNTADGEFVPGEILVKFRNEKDAVDAEHGSKNPRLNEIFARFGVNNARRPFARARAKSLAKVIKLTTQTGNLKEALAALREQPEVEYAELNMIVHTQTAPNDPYYSTSGAWGQSYRDLWGLQSISAEPAWDISQGDGVLVAVVDTGLDYNHEDIAANVWSNDGEVGLDGNGNDKRSNGIDDDGNGLIDDWRGWDFVTIDGNPADNDPMDNHGHGTHVSGTIAAVGNNGLGVIGVAPHAKIMAVKGLDANGSGSIEDLSNGIIYAADKGASVINLSWGGFGPTPQTLIDAISYAHDVKGAVVVAAAGNNNFDVGTQVNGFYPACIRDVVAVAAVNHLDAKASFSNFGAKIDVTAPGGGDTDPTGLLIQPDRSILSLKSSAAGSSMTSSGQLVVGTKYLRQAGTSMASPHVAGVAALIRAQHPEFSPEQVRQVLRSGANDIGATGFDTQFGYGRLNASGSVTIAAPLAAELTGPVGFIGGLQVNVTGSVGGANLSSWRLEYGAGTAPSSWTLITTSSTTINAGTLATWNLSGINDGTYTLHLVAQALTGEIYEDRLTVVLDGLIITDPSPLSMSITRGDQGVTIKGTVASANFSRYFIQIFAIRNNTWVNNSAITLANGGLQQVQNGVLGTWDTTGAPPDTYQIFVTEVFTNNTSISDSTKVALDSSLHPGWPIDLGLLTDGASSLGLTNHVNAVDVDGNGTKEIIIGYNDKVSVLDHTGTQLPGWPQTIDLQNNGAHIQISPAVADLDDDGSPEIVAANDKNQMFIWRANGTLWSGWPKNLAGFMTSIAIDDLNGDGQKEIIIAAGGSVGVRVFDKNGVLLPGWPVNTNALNSPPAIGDVDGDGQKEIVVATLTGPTRLYMIKANGVVMPNWPKAINPQLASNFLAWSYPTLGDLDGDGAMECVIGSANGFVYAFRADGSFVPGWPQATKAVAVNAPAIGDIDGDGLPEVIAGNDRIIENNASADYLFAWHADGTILPNWPVKYDRQITASSFGYGAPALADLDQDGRADVIVTSDTTSGSYSALNAYKYDGSKVPGFPKPTLDTGAFVTNTVAVADLDSDGLMEMAWIDRNAKLYVWDLSAPSTAVAPWPMFQHDERHTGASLPTPETIPPTAIITSPVAGANVAGFVNITTQASDNVGVVNIELYKDNVLVGSSTQSPFTFEWITIFEGNGPHTFVSKAYDAAGNVGTSAPVVFNVDNTSPAAAITAPSDGALLTGSVVTISADATDNSGIQTVDFYYDGNILIGTDTSAPFTVSWNTSVVSSGDHVLYAVATDTAGNSTSSSSITVTLDNLPPFVAFTYPANGASITGIVNLAVNAFDVVGVQKVEYYRDGSVLLGTSSSAPFGLSWDTSAVTEGSHTLFAVATDLAGNTATSATISVNVDRTLPAVSLTAPLSGAVVTGNAVAVSASASDNTAVRRVDFYLDSNVLLGTDNTSPYGISWDTTTTTTGPHTLIAVATDLAGNTKTSTVVNVSVDNAAPVVSLTAPANGAFVTGTLAVSATATDNLGISKVEFYMDNNVLLATDTSSPYTFNWNSTTVTQGAHTLYAIAQDTTGLRTTSAAIAITVDNTAPTVAITSPLNGATVQRNSVVNINANASDNSGVVKVEFYVGTTLRCTVTTAPYTCAWQVPTQKTNFSLKATAYDVVGKTATHTISVSSK